MPKDYLTSLPAELFDYICDLVVIAKPKQYLGGISKAFLPSARERTFWSVHIYKEPAAIRFVEALAASPGAASHVRYLTLHLPETAFSSEAAAPVLRRAISHLRNITGLSLSSSFDCAAILPLLANELPQLDKLELEANESLTSQLLIQILSGPKKIVKLRTLSLSTSYGSRSSVHASLAPKALIEVVELAEQEKVEVSGGRFWDAIDARKARDARLEAEEEERREIARAIARRAART
ncbi:hypothetical protein NBRC10512_005439 [Rhodotorula toruloides]|uniref:Proteophosphoglycan ppg4 n=1 Tax=Rhodotorula toruloides (strain NP11) TaxID=1130832 RepID=M7WET6_RHOT1|nr:uncharacterized protein RHTO_05505 [Rhodotorula toruloides NP11]EMS18937.1 hypothetical protein RHTO_05505 [Rhodotorula toruloides NP11]